ncbi:MAG TPA: Crp/Fnr family transcriptional regulator [Woeseiaceae bacterium]
MTSAAQPHVIADDALPRNAHVDAARGAFACAVCPAWELGLCSILRNGVSEAERSAAGTLPMSTVHTVPARRTIFHPKEWSEFVPVICSGWSVSSIALPDGRRQILSFLLPGDAVCTAFLFGPLSGRHVEAVTEVTYRKFKRHDLRALLFGNPDLFDRVAKIWIEERVQADQLALDLGRRTASERIARQILNLAERLAKRGMMSGQTMEFPLRQRHIADATGLTPVHVSKVLGEFQRARLIEISSRSLTIINEAELRVAADWR